MRNAQSVAELEAVLAGAWPRRRTVVLASDAEESTRRQPENPFDLTYKTYTKITFYPTDTNNISFEFKRVIYVFCGELKRGLTV